MNQEQAFDTFDAAFEDICKSLQNMMSQGFDLSASIEGLEDALFDAQISKGKKVTRKDVCGLPVSIEYNKGDTRKGKSKEGKEWATVMPCAYGYIRGTLGVDGDHLDVYVGPSANEKECKSVWVIHQKKADGSYDEDKVMLGFRKRSDAVDMYRKVMKNKEVKSLAVTELTLEAFKEKIKDSRKNPKRLGVGRHKLFKAQDVSNQPTQDSAQARFETQEQTFQREGIARQGFFVIVP